MAVDVTTRIRIERPLQQVAAFAGDPDNALRWYANITEVEWETPRPVAVGSRVSFVARFLGRRLAYTYEVRELSAVRLVMSTAQGPFPMTTTYLFEPDGDGATWMTLRNEGAPSGFSKVAGLAMAPAMRRANRKDLACLKTLLEAGEPR